MGLFDFSGKNKLPYQLKLFVSGESSHTESIVACIESILDEKIAGQYNLEVVNILMNDKPAKQYGVISTPTLAWIKPEPVRKIFGSLYVPKKMREALAFLDEMLKESPSPGK